MRRTINDLSAFFAPPPAGAGLWGAWLMIMGLMTAALYLRMCVASLFDDYQVGMEALKAWVWPAGVLYILWLAAWLMPGRIAILRMAGLCSAGTLALCAGMALALAAATTEPNASTWMVPELRSFQRVLHVALTQPRFSNRSVGVLVGTAAHAAVVLLLCVWLARHRFGVGRQYAARLS